MTTTPGWDEEQARILLHQSSHGYGDNEVYRYRAAVAANAYALLALGATVRDGLRVVAQQLHGGVDDAGTGES